LTAEGLRTVLASTNLRRLTCLAIGTGGSRDEPLFELLPDVAAALLRLPHLVRLRISVRHCAPEIQRLLATSTSVPWVSLCCWGEPDYRVRQFITSEEYPPFDDDPEEAGVDAF
jgi:hypothetical protein